MRRSGLAEFGWAALWFVSGWVEAGALERWRVPVLADMAVLVVMYLVMAAAVDVRTRGKRETTRDGARTAGRVHRVAPGAVLAARRAAPHQAADSEARSIPGAASGPPQSAGRMVSRPTLHWTQIAPADAADINLAVRDDIVAPINEMGERCPWPWEPQQMVGVPLGQYHCPWCGAMVIAGIPHIDYAERDAELDYPGGWFGKSWGAAVCDPGRHMPTPVGHPCVDCKEPIADGQQGMLIPDATTGVLVAFELTCFLRGLGIAEQ